MLRMPLVVLFFSLAVPVLAQVAPAPDAPPSANAGGPLRTIKPQAPEHSPAPVSVAPQIPPSQPLATLRVRTNLVNVFFIVRDSHRHLVQNLQKSDCTVLEDNVPQTLKSFSNRPDLPLTLGVLLDTSLSQQNVLATEKRAGDAFLRAILKPKDEAFLMSFDVNVDLLADLTGSLHTLEQAMNGAGINSSSGNYANGTIPSIGKPKGTVLYDAVYLATHDTLRDQAGRKALVLLTDGQDEGSQESLKSAIEAAQKADAIVYVLLISDPGPYGMLDFSGAAPIHKLAKETGGTVFEIGHNGRKMQAAFTTIEKELRQEYEVTYTPTNRAQDGAYRRIHVDCRQNGTPLHVRAREGYYALQSGKTTSPSDR
ncbi:MAG: VWA domain-containing protein [Acidobacteriaceae bacterium]